MEDPATSVTSSLWASLNSWFTSTVFFVLLNLMIATIVFTSNLPNNNNNQQEQQQDDQKNNNNNNNNNNNRPPIARSPSILHRLKSFNFYPQKSQNESSETHYHQHPLEVAATQYVFNQPLDYQHFDFDSTNPDPANPSAAGNQFSGQTPTNGYEPTNPDPIHTDNRFPVETQIGRYDSDEFEPNLAGEDNADEFESLDEVYSRLKSGGHDRTKSDGSIQTKAPVKMKKSASLKVGFTHLEDEEIVEARRPATVKAVRVVNVNDDDDVEVDSKADDFINKFKNDLKLQRIESIMKTKEARNRGT
ncbi:uncharacterized protein LOC143626135 [Bidens hawaiensis]|uniref:uncharacterized protein LOC143626135 n=1 Tax=Bidens hawaiensis TaxID=980011 RepID=UPI00404AE509